MDEEPHKVPTGMVFGVFDGLHDGHRFLLRGARARCDRLIVVIAIPEMVLRLKSHLPKYSLEERVRAIKDFDPSIEIIPSDAEPRTWGSLREYSPDIVFLGYDQNELGDELERLGVAYCHMGSHRPDVCKSSLLNRP